MTPISVCIITKNEENRIEKCLAPLKNYPFEIIVADTGSTDKTKEIAGKYADKVLDFQWVNDFSAARNFSTEQATHDYCLILDSDEYLTELDFDKLQQIISDHPEAVGLLAIDNHYTSNQRDAVYRDRLPRFFNKRLYHFEAPIHEQIVHRQHGALYECREIPLTVDHVGYAGTPEELKAKVERNNALLFQELEKDPENPYLYFQIGQSYNMIYDYEKSYEYYQKALAYDVNPQEEWVQMMIIAYGNAMLHTDRIAEALALESVYDAFAVSADFLCLMGRIYLLNEQYIKAMMEYVKALHCPVAHEVGTNTFIPSYNLGYINELMGKKEDALKLYRNCGDFPMALERIAELTAKES